MPSASGSALPSPAAQLPLIAGPSSRSARALISALAIPGTPEHVKAARSFTDLVLGMYQFNDDGIAACWSAN